MTDKINELLRRVEEFKPKAAADVEEFRIKILGKKGELNALLEEFKGVAPELKRELGQKINHLKSVATERINALRSQMQQQAADAPACEDMSRPGSAERLGSRHPIALVKNQIVEVFSRLGYTVAEGPEIEDDWHVFSALNFPPEHPARDMQDTFFIEMKQSLLYFAKEVFGEQTAIRMRPSYFPFTEPSAEVDVSCNLCGGKGCPVCKGTGWLEIMGCGMVDPNVLEANGIDPKKYSGFAFGMGIERIAMLKYGVKDLRLYFENDVRFLHQFDTAL